MNSDRKAMSGAALIVAGLALSGCQTNWHEELGAAEFGEPNRQTYAAMIVNPDPVYDEPLATSAEKASDAVERYRNDAVKQPESIRSTSGAGGGGGGGGGGG